MQYNESYTTLTGADMVLKLIEFNPGNDVEIPYYWYEIIPKALNKPVGKISIRIGDNYHSYLMVILAMKWMRNTGDTGFPIRHLS